MNTIISDSIAAILTEIRSTPWMDITSLSNDSSSQLSEIIRRHTNKLSPELSERVEEEFIGVGPLKPLFEDPSITEIILNSHQEIWFEKSGKLFQFDDQFQSELTYRQFVDYLCRKIQLPFTIERPFLCGAWGNLRVHIAGYNMTEGSFGITIRKKSESPWTLESLEKLGWCDAHQKQILETLVTDHKNILIIGGTGSGKTSALSAMVRMIPNRERVLILEDTAEISKPNYVSQKLLTREDPQGILPSITLADLVRQALRMRPDRLIVGEVRGAEAKELLMALSTGHAGSLGTLHADGAKEALLRLEMLIQLGAPQWSLDAVRRLIQLALHNIILVGRTEDGRRILKGIFELKQHGPNGFETNRLDLSQ